MTQARHARDPEGHTRLDRKLLLEPEPGDSMRFEGRTVLITGAARGIGASHVRGFLREGAFVMAGDLLAFSDDLDSERLRTTHHDVTDAASWERVVAQTQAELGPIDVLVNNAGVGGTGGVLDQTLPDFEAIMAVNVIGPFLGMRAIVPSMVSRGSGSVVNVSSISGMTGRPDGLAYTTSKWALRGMTKTAAADVAHTGVRINSVHPGIIRTPMTDGLDDSLTAHQPISRFGRAEEVTAMVLFLASDDASYCTGAEYLVDGGYMVGSVPAQGPTR